MQEMTKKCLDSKGGDDKSNFMSNMLGKLMSNPKTAGYLKDPEFVNKLMAI